MKILEHKHLSRNNNQSIERNIDIKTNMNENMTKHN